LGRFRVCSKIKWFVWWWKRSRC